MAIEVNIILELRERIVYDESIIVKHGSRVRFIVRVWSQFFERYQFLDSIKVMLYFDGITPSGFKKRSIIDINNIAYRSVTHSDYIIAENVVKEPGEYKFGYRATTIDGSELFDEDPFLIVI